MKQVFLLLLGGVLLACNSTDQPATKVAGETTPAVATAGPSDSANLTTIQWLDPENQTLGTITKGQVVEISWRFKNTGSKPLTIADVRAGCGCTTPDVPREPIAPGAEGVIRAKFNSENFGGHVTKDVTVVANNRNTNSAGENRLTFSADIKE